MAAQGQKIKEVLEKAITGQEATKSIVTAGDFAVCPICQKAEEDGTIPFDRPYSNGKMHPSFHGKTCRCREITSEKMVEALEVRATENMVDVGFFEQEAAEGAAAREFGTGNSSPDPTVRPALDNLGNVAFTIIDAEIERQLIKAFME